jgi:uncharacterized membrane protein
MNWLDHILPYFPSIISIFLVALSRLTDRYLKSLVTGYNTKQSSVLEESKPVMEAIALDWGERLGFFSSMFTALFSSISIASTQTYGLAIVTLVALLVVFGWMFYWIFSHEAGGLVTTRTMHGKLLHATVCHIILVVVNIILIAELLLIQLSMTSSAVPSK